MNQREFDGMGIREIAESMFSTVHPTARTSTIDRYSARFAERLDRLAGSGFSWHGSPLIPGLWQPPTPDSSTVTFDQDRMSGTLPEELDGRSAQADEGPKPYGSVYRTVNQLSSEYGFGVSRVRPDTNPAFVFWPHRLRAPHLVHGVHALTAALLSKLGIPVELHLDDTDMGRLYADRAVADFTEAVNAWFEACGASQPPKVLRISELFEAEAAPERAVQLWQIAREWYASTNSVLDALTAAKVIVVEAESVAVAPTQANRILRPLYTWLALDDALSRHGHHGGHPAAAVTIGGFGEQQMWDLWHARPRARSVTSIFVPRMRSVSENSNPWQYAELRRDAPFGVRDLERLLVLSAGSRPAEAPLLQWVFLAGRLADLVLNSGVSGVLTQGGAAHASWPEVYDLLNRSPAEGCRLLANSVAGWFYREAVGSW